MEPCDPLGGLPASAPLGLEEPWLLAVLPLLLELELEGSEGILEREEELEAEGRLGTEEEFEDELEGDGSEGLLELGEDDEEGLGMLGMELELEEELVVSQPASPRHRALAAIMARGSVFILDILLPIEP